MSAAQTRCDHQSCLQGTFRFLRVVSDGVHDECDVVWHPAEEEDPYQGQDDHDGPLLLEAFRAAQQPSQDTGAADDQGDCGQQEAHHVVEQARHQLPVSF